MISEFFKFQVTTKYCTQFLTLSHFKSKIELKMKIATQSKCVLIFPLLQQNSVPHPSCILFYFDHNIHIFCTLTSSDGLILFIIHFQFVYECVKVPMSAHQVLPLTGHIFEVNYSPSATWVNKI